MKLNAACVKFCTEWVSRMAAQPILGAYDSIQSTSGSNQLSVTKKPSKATS